MIGGMAAAGAVWNVVGDGAGTAEAVPGGCTNCTFPPAPVIPNFPQYGNILGLLPQSGFGANPQTCPNGNCYNPFATTFFPIGGQNYTSGTLATATGGVQTCTVGVPCTVPQTANFQYPLVAASSGTQTTIQLPIFMI
jgi:hypothetical protein